MPPDDYTLTPVDHDPYTHTPVDYDPFAAEKFLSPVLADASKAAAQGDYQALTAGRTPDNSPVLYPTADPRFGITQQDIDNGIGVGLATSGGGLSTKGIRAYHGSPHDFDAFSMDKIGTGEGAQAYGHGLYFAEAEPVAKIYRDAMSDASVNGRPFDANNPVHRAAQMVGDYGSRESAAQEALARSQHDPGDYWGQVSDYIKSNRALPEIKSNGKMYQVDINADPEHFLDWDKPNSQQHPIVQSALDKLGLSKEEALASAANNPETIRQLRELGVPGAKYLDQGSRAAGDGSRNYVVFDDKMVNIVKKYGLAGLSMLPPAVAAEYSKRLTPVDHDPFAGT